VKYEKLDQACVFAISTSKIIFCIKVDQFLSRHDQSAHSSNICMYFVKSSEILLTYLNALHQLSKVVS